MAGPRTNEWLMAMASLLITAVVFLAAAKAHGAEPARDAGTIFDVPRVQNISLDGGTSDWSNQGLVVETMGIAWNRPWPLKTASPQLRLGWDQRGLLACITVHNPTPHEYDDIRHLFKGDSVEFFLCSTPGSSDRYMLVISPGLDAKYPEPRHCFFPDPSEAGERDLSHMTFSFARRGGPESYTMEVLLPWANLNIVPSPGRILGLQVYAMEARDPTRCIAAMWHPAGDSHVDPNAVHRIRLSEDTMSSTIGPQAAVQHHENGTAVRVLAPVSMAGKRLEVRTDDQFVVGTLSARGNQASGALDLAGETIQQVAVTVDGQAIPTFGIPDADNPITVLSSKLRCSMEACVFASTRFPEAQLSGASSYRITKVSYYDASFQLVKEAGAPGRYAATIEIADRHGNTSRRFRSLFRVPDHFRGWDGTTQPISELPRLLAADSHVIELVHAGSVDGADMDWLHAANALADPRTAALLAYLQGEPRSPASAKGDFALADRQWWVQFKGRLYGTDTRWTRKLALPMVTRLQRWPIVRAGNETDAGLKIGTAAQIDDLCRRGVAISQDAVSVCLVRHGVRFFSTAYGRAANSPMTVDTSCQIYSAAKPLAGTMMMMLVDDGLVASLDDEVGRYLVPFRQAKAKTPLTIRHLFNHRAGFPLAVWEDDTPDIEEIVAAFCPALDVGVYRYSDTGYSVAGKVMESVTGQALPLLEVDYLLAPLGMSHTRVFGAGHGVWTTAEDYSRLGQMLLNRGGYGEQKFFSEATFDKMLPRQESGIGIRATGRLVLGEDAFGHDGSNSSLLCISPAHDLVMAIVCSGTTKAFREACADAILRSVVDGIMESPQVIPKRP